MIGALLLWVIKRLAGPRFVVDHDAITLAIRETATMLNLKC